MTKKNMVFKKCCLELTTQKGDVCVALDYAEYVRMKCQKKCGNLGCPFYKEREEQIRCGKELRG